MKELLEFNEKPRYEVIFPQELDMKSEDIILEELPRLLSDDEKIPYCSSHNLPQYSSLVVSFKKNSVSSKLKEAVKEFCEHTLSRNGYSAFKKYTIKVYELGLFNLANERNVFHQVKLNNVKFDDGDTIIGLSFYIPKTEKQKLKNC